MAFRKITSYPGFWKSVLFLGVLFALIYCIIDLFFSFGFDFEAYSTAYFSSTERIAWYLMALLAGGFVYGFFFTYLKFRRKIKELEKNEQT